MFDKLFDNILTGIKVITHFRLFIIIWIIIAIFFITSSFFIKDWSFATWLLNNWISILWISFISFILYIAEKWKEKNKEEDEKEKEDESIISREISSLDNLIKRIKKIIEETKLIIFEHDIIHTSYKYNEIYSSLGYFKKNKLVYLWVEQCINNWKIFKNNEPIEFYDIKNDDILSVVYLWVNNKDVLEKIFNELNKKYENSDKYKIIKVKNPKNIFIILKNWFEDKKLDDLIKVINDYI